MKQTIISVLVLLFSMSMLQAQKQPWFDESKTTEQRVALLVKEMTLDEKIGQMMNNAPAIERLGIPKYNWWNECLHKDC